MNSVLARGLLGGAALAAAVSLALGSSALAAGAPASFTITDRWTGPDGGWDFSAFDTAHQPKELIIMPGGHFDAYTKGFDVSSGRARDWFNQHLAA